MNSNSFDSSEKNTSLFSYTVTAGWTCSFSAKAFTSNLNGSYAGRGQHCMGFSYVWSREVAAKLSFPVFPYCLLSIDSVFYSKLLCA